MNQRVTFLRWMCFEDGREGIFDGGFEPTTVENLMDFLLGLAEKSRTSGVEDEVLQLELGAWHFGAAAVRRVERQLREVFA